MYTKLQLKKCNKYFPKNGDIEDLNLSLGRDWIQNKRSNASAFTVLLQSWDRRMPPYYRISNSIE